MTAHHNQIENHGAWEALRQLASEVQNVIAGGAITNVDQADALRRTVVVVDALDRRLALVGRDLMTTDWLATVNRPARQALALVQDVAAGGNVDQSLGQLPTHVDQLALAVAQLPVLTSEAEAKVVTDEMKSARRVAKEAKKAAEDTETHSANLVNGIESRLGALEARLVEGRAAIQNTAEQVQAQATNLVTSIDESMRTRSAELSDRAEKSVRDMEERTDKRSQEAVDRVAARLEEQADAAVASLESKAVEFSEAQQAALAELARLREEVRHVVGLVTTDAIAGGYEESAANQRKAANFWRWTSGALFMLGAAAATYFFAFRFSDDTSVADSVRHATLSLLLLGPAAAAGRWSAGHREREEHYESLSLRLSSIDPFLADLAKEDRDAIKTTLTPTFFASERPRAGAGDAAGASDWTEIAKGAVSAATKRGG